MLSAAERLVLGKATRGFVADRDLTSSQIKTAATLVDRQLIKIAGQEGDRTKVYTATNRGKQAYEAGL